MAAGIPDVVDGYLRLSDVAPARWSPVPTTPGATVFVDLDVSPFAPDARTLPALVAKRIVTAPPGFFLYASNVLVRWPTPVGAAVGDLARDNLREHAAAVRELVEPRSAPDVAVGLVTMPVGGDVDVTWSDGATRSGDRTRELLASCREVEVHHLLRAGNGIWTPQTYHYHLPSGEHTSMFVRVADAFRSPRDAVALTTWLHPYVRAGLAVVTDSPTMVPLVVALHQVARAAGYEPAAVVTLDEYAANRYEVDRAVAAAANAEWVLGLLSITSTGTTSHRMAEALAGAGLVHALETLVSRSGGSASRLDELPGFGVLEPWLGLGPSVETYGSPSQCELCRDADRARLVYIDPRSFEPLVLPRPELLMPDANRAAETREIWEFYDAVDGVAVNALPNPRTKDFRGNRQRLAVRCLPHWLLDVERYGDAEEHRRFLDVVECRTKEQVAELGKFERRKEEHDRFRPEDCDLVVTTSDDRGAPGFDAFLRAVAEGLGCGPWNDDQVVAVGGMEPSIDGQDGARVAAAHHVLVVTLGAVTGTSMQRLLVGVQTVLRDVAAGTRATERPPTQVAGLVLHLRTESQREWEVLRNAYSHRLLVLWRTHLPLASPFDDEHELLTFVTISGDDRAATFLERRLEYLQDEPRWDVRTASVVPGQPDPYAVFWGMPLDPDADSDPNPAERAVRWPGRDRPRLRPGSRFGHLVRATTTFAAVAVAIQHARLAVAPKGAPAWHYFEMPAILRSYFDPPIVAAILRWLRPHEAWWGDRDTEAASVLAEITSRADDDGLRILIPELLLAAAQGKVSRRGTEWLSAESRHLIQAQSNGWPVREGGRPWTDREIGPVAAGLALLRTAGPPLEQAVADLQRELDHLLAAVAGAVEDADQAELKRLSRERAHVVTQLVAVKQQVARHTRVIAPGGGDASR